MKIAGLYYLLDNINIPHLYYSYEHKRNDRPLGKHCIQ